MPFDKPKERVGARNQSGAWAVRISYGLLSNTMNGRRRGGFCEGKNCLEHMLG